MQQNMTTLTSKQRAINKEYKYANFPSRAIQSSVMPQSIKY